MSKDKKSRLAEWGPLIVLIIGTVLIAGVVIGFTGRGESTPSPPDPIKLGIAHNENLILVLTQDVAELQRIVERGMVILPSEPNVRIDPDVEGMLTPQISRVLGLTLVWSVQTGKIIDINSFNDSRHMGGSLHYLDLAIDLDVGGDIQTDLNDLGAFLVTHLPGGYDVIINWDHIHVEWEGE